MESANLCVNDLACTRNNTVLFEKLCFELKPGEILLLEGPNGSGKTSLLRLLAGLATPESGRILWQNQTLNSIRYEYACSLSYIGHAAAVKVDLSVDENLNWLAPGYEQQDRFVALEQAGLQGLEDEVCSRLSAGQHRRVALARLYLQPTPLWILDEPFVALDKTSIKSLENLLKIHSQKGGMAILTTHQDFNLDKIEIKRLQMMDFYPADYSMLETAKEMEKKPEIESYPGIENK